MTVLANAVGMTVLAKCAQCEKLASLAASASETRGTTTLAAINSAASDQPRPLSILRQLIN